MKTKLFTIVLLLFSQIGFAQDAKSILDKVSAAYASSGYVLSFTINTEEMATKTTYSHDGKAYLKGNKFKIDVPDGITWFDGKTQWLYLSGSDEVNVTNPTGEELAAISPVALLSIYKSGFKLSYKKEIKEKGKSLYLIEMTPLKKGSEVSKFTLKVDKATNLFSEINMKGNNGMNNVLIIKKSEKNPGLADSFFAFNKKEYPNTEVIDLR